MGKMQISSAAINIPGKSNYIKKPLLNTAEHKTLECIQDWYKEGQYGLVIKENYSIVKIQEGLDQYNDSNKMLLLEILKYKICACFQLNKDNGKEYDFNMIHNFMSIAGSLLAGNVKDTLLFYESILDILNIDNRVPCDGDLELALTPNSAYLNSIILYTVKLKGIVSKFISENNTVPLDDNLDNTACLVGVVKEAG